jgi:hypothetical protein
MDRKHLVMIAATGITCGIASAVSAQTAPAPVAKTPAENCFAQVRQQQAPNRKPNDTLLRQCLELWRAERAAKPRPVIVEGRGITPADG